MPLRGLGFREFFSRLWSLGFYGMLLGFRGFGFSFRCFQGLGGGFLSPGCKRQKMVCRGIGPGCLMLRHLASQVRDFKVGGGGVASLRVPGSDWIQTRGIDSESCIPGKGVMVGVGSKHHRYSGYSLVGLPAGCRVQSQGHCNYSAFAIRIQAAQCSGFGVTGCSRDPGTKLSLHSLLRFLYQVRAATLNANPKQPLERPESLD